MEAEYQGKRLPTQEEWKEIAESLTKVDKNWYFQEPIHKKLWLKLAGYRNWTNGQYYFQGTLGYYWSSSPSTTNSYYAAVFLAGGGVIANTNPRGDGFSIRCVKEWGKEEVNTSEKVECEVSDSSTHLSHSKIIEELKSEKKIHESKAQEIQKAIDIISLL